MSCNLYLPLGYEKQIKKINITRGGTFLLSQFTSEVKRTFTN